MISRDGGGVDLMAAPFQVSPNDIEALRLLVHRMHDTPRQSLGTAEKKRKAIAKRASDAAIAKAGPYRGGTQRITFPPAPHLSILELRGDELQERLSQIQWDLGAQVSITSESFDLWLGTGESPPPHYPERVMIILGRAKETLWERAFLATFCGHFDTAFGRQYDNLVARARVVNAYPPR